MMTSIEAAWATRTRAPARLVNTTPGRNQHCVLGATAYAWPTGALRMIELHADEARQSINDDE